MQSQIIGKIITSLDGSLKLNENEAIEFNLPGYKAVPIFKTNFHAIEQSNKENNADDGNKNNNNVITNTKIAFIDGGNVELLSAPNFSLQFVRVFACIFQDNKRIFSKKKEFYVLAKCINRLNDEGKAELTYTAEIFNANKEPGKDGKTFIDASDLLFAANDETIRDGIHNASISAVGEIARKFGELALAKQIVNELGEDGIIVLDGSLQATITNHKKYLEQLYAYAHEKGIVVSALAKTSRLFSNNGNSMAGLLNEISANTQVNGVICKNIAWYYYPVVEIENDNHKAELFFVKLNKASEYVFRFEIFKDCLAEKKQDSALLAGFLSELFSAIANNSRDLAFPGYPYGLIFADKLARVSNNEKEYLTTMFQAKAGKSWLVIKKYLNAVNAHDVLDRIG
ncbi:TPA: DNA double-strand break repair nuclease NurA [Candidatus Woesearchaeota archaeon]|nr:DNA double-strand break repair nuclease NurA [Candidatus Woesearchaeota archaeon]